MRDNANGTPSFSHQVTWVRTREWPISVFRFLVAHAPDKARPVFQAPRMIRMRMGEHNRVGLQAIKFSQPIQAAIDHHIRAAT